MTVHVYRRRDGRICVRCDTWAERWRVAEICAALRGARDALELVISGAAAEYMPEPTLAAARLIVEGRALPSRYVTRAFARRCAAQRAQQGVLPGLEGGRGGGT